jgi:hypothetical protein
MKSVGRERKIDSVFKLREADWELPWVVGPYVRETRAGTGGKLPHADYSIELLSIQVHCPDLKTLFL